VSLYLKNGAEGGEEMFFFLILQENDYMAEQIKISVVINTYNAERYLKRVLESVKEFDEVVVCDMESTDFTCQIAEQMGCRVVTFAKGDCRIVEPARQFAIDSAAYPWVLVVDADELVSAELREFLYKKVLEMETSETKGLAIPRKNYFMGRFMHATYPDYILRFFDKRVTKWPPEIHTSPQVDGAVERIDAKRLSLAFEHLANDSVRDILRKNNVYSDYEVPRRRKKNYGIAALVYRPAFRFLKSYLFKGGWRDGVAGFIYAALQAYYQFEVVAKLVEERKNGVQ
jgi:glycosyltransferase involved in cell wall biosynthesis